MVKSCPGCRKPVALPDRDGAFVCPYCNAGLTVTSHTPTSVRIGQTGVIIFAVGVGVLVLAMLIGIVAG